jgi:tRNA threonylcarbamoyladenosine modification (KEOPS) complex  Pcc1 subunit
MLEADDLAALRAGTFTWCGLIEAAAKTASQFDD